MSTCKIFLSINLTFETTFSFIISHSNLSKVLNYTKTLQNCLEVHICNAKSFDYYWLFWLRYSCNN